MKVTTKLLKQFGNIPASDEEIVKLIKEHIAEVDYFHNLEDDYRDILIAQIVEKKDHPDAEKLAIYQINYGQEDTIQVVAGDKTLQVGDKAAYLQIGAKVPYSIHTEVKPFVVKKVKLRGIESNGMLASEKELNIGNNHTNVMVLPEDAPIGESFSNYYELKDTVIDLENKALTNRGDLFGILGIARELTAIVGNRFESPEWYLIDKENIKAEDNCLNIEIINDAESLCPRYVAVALDNLEVKDSPIWLKSVLVRCGIKPTNNVVDITNYISLLIGQPLHAFDYDKLIKQDPKSTNKAFVNIRMANHEEKILGLDEKIYDLDEKVMVIADSTHPIAIAGVIGSKDSEVDENTKRIILESANFDKSSIRRTSMKLGIFTEAATRFKHNLDPQQCLPAILKAVELIKELSECKVASDVVDIYNQKPEPRTIQIQTDDINKVLGTEIEKDEITNLLENLEFKVQDKDYLYVNPPSWRKDIDIKEDIYEDIGRIYGFNNIEPQLPVKEIMPPRTNKVLVTKRLIREILSNNGCNETVNYSFTSLDSFKKCNLDSDLAYRIKNSLSPELSLMRTNLLQSLLEKARENLERGIDKLCIYEINIPHLKNYIQEDQLPVEKLFLSLLIANSKNDISGSPYYASKKYLEMIFEGLNIDNIKYELISESLELELPLHIKNSINLFEANSSALVSYQGIILGVVGEIKNSVKENFKLPMFTSAIDIDIEQLSEIKSDLRKYKEQPVYPPFTHDLCFEMEEETKYYDIKEKISKVVNNDILYGRVECLDIYQDKNEKKKMTFRITVSNYNKTLDELDRREIVKNIEDKVSKEYKAKLV